MSKHGVSRENRDSTGDVNMLNGDLEKTFVPNTDNSILGCAHYQRACKIFCTVCNRFYTCHYCHDSDEEASARGISNHSFNRFSSSNDTNMVILLCMHCKHLNQITKNSNHSNHHHLTCTNCSSLLAKYTCLECLVFESDGNKRIFHCEECRLCRVGDKSLFFHCTMCHCCLALAFKDSHKCIERSLESDCPICSEYLFTTRTGVIFMPCGHAIHYLCHEEHIKRSYQCPICCKSLTNMKPFFSQIDTLLAGQPMPPEMASMKASIFCNDCEKRSIVPYHMSQYHKCTHCSSYNTSVLKMISLSGQENATISINIQEDTTAPSGPVAMYALAPVQPEQEPSSHPLMNLSNSPLQ